MVVQPVEREKLEAWYRPHNMDLYQLIGRDMGWEALSVERMDTESFVLLIGTYKCRLLLPGSQPAAVYGRRGFLAARGADEAVGSPNDRAGGCSPCAQQQLRMCSAWACGLCAQGCVCTAVLWSCVLVHNTSRSRGQGPQGSAGLTPG